MNKQFAHARESKVISVECFSRLSAAIGKGLDKNDEQQADFVAKNPDQDVSAVTTGAASSSGEEDGQITTSGGAETRAGRAGWAVAAQAGRGTLTKSIILRAHRLRI